MPHGKLIYIYIHTHRIEVPNVRSAEKEIILLAVFGRPDRLVGWKFKLHTAAQQFFFPSILWPHGLIAV